MTEAEFNLALRARLRDLRTSRNQSQAQIAGLLGLEEDTYGSYERRSNIPLYYVPKVAAIYGVSLEWLLTGRDAPRRRLTAV